MVKSILTGAQRLLTHHIAKKGAMTVFQIEQLVACLLVRILLGVAGLLLPQMLACQTVSSSVMPTGLAGESAKDGYVKDSLSHLSVSEALGICVYCFLFILVSI